MNTPQPQTPSATTPSALVSTPDQLPTYNTHAGLKPSVQRRVPTNAGAGLGPQSTSPGILSESRAAEMNPTALSPARMSN